MNYSRITSSSVDSNISTFNLAEGSIFDATSWSLIVLFFMLNLVVIAAGINHVADIVFPGSAFALALFFYQKRPTAYLSFILWLWFLTPLVRRLSDYQTAFKNPSPILLAPFLATAIISYTIIRQIPRSINTTFPFVICFTSLIYGVTIGFIQGGSITSIIIGLLDWWIPVSFGFYFFINWHSYPVYRKIFESVLPWASLVMGIYGFVQYLVAPAWDVLWLQNAIDELGILSFGRPYVREIRVWSTMNGPLDFAVTMMACLMVCTNARGPMSILAPAAGFMSLLLSLARTAWGGFIVGTTVLLSSGRLKVKMRFLTLSVFLLACLIPITLMEQFNTTIFTRIETLKNPTQDVSLLARQETYSRVAELASRTLIGYGIGGDMPNFGTDLDSSILSSVFALGILGSLLYLGGFIFIALPFFRNWLSRDVDSFINICRSIVIAAIAMLPLGPVLVGVTGVVIWGFLGLGLAGLKFHMVCNKADSDSGNCCF